MEDRPEDLPKPPRTTAARPFFSPRPSSGEGVTGPLELGRRRAAQLFTPPSSATATPAADSAPLIDANAEIAPAELPASSAADGSSESTAAAPDSEFEKEPDFEGDWTPAPMLLPEQTLDAESLLASSNVEDDDRLVVEQFEHEEIELTASASNVPDEHAIEVIGYDDANSFLQATTTDGETPQIDGLRLESTEFSFEQAPAPPRLNVDSFWASEPFFAPDAPTTPSQSAEPVADETEATIDEDTAGEGESELVMESASSVPDIDDQPLEWADDPSTTISHAQGALEPEPEYDPESARAADHSLADISPPWMSRLTPASTQALEALKESEPWELTPARSQEPIPDVPAIAAAVDHDVADALERIAARVRDGDIDVPSGTNLSDEAALSAVLTALLRSRR